jgi:hypothetical protein
MEIERVKPPSAPQLQRGSEWCLHRFRCRFPMPMVGALATQRSSPRCWRAFGGTCMISLPCTYSLPSLPCSLGLGGPSSCCSSWKLRARLGHLPKHLSVCPEPRHSCASCLQRVVFRASHTAAALCLTRRPPGCTTMHGGYGTGPPMAAATPSAAPPSCPQVGWCVGGLGYAPCYLDAAHSACLRNEMICEHRPLEQLGRRRGLRGCFVLLHYCSSSSPAGSAEAGKQARSCRLALPHFPSSMPQPSGIPLGDSL